MADFFDVCPTSDDNFPHPGIHVHRRDNSSGTLVVFIHGWGGKGYRTWRDIPSVVYRADPGGDVALVDYVSGPRRIRSESKSLDVTVDYILDELQALSATYTDFFLIGHSMGGVVAAAVLRRSHEVGLSVHMRARGLLSIASPRAGINRIPFAANLIKDSIFLAAQAEVHQRNFEFFTNLVDIEPHIGSTKAFHIPHNVAIATYDRVVNQMTSSGDLPRSHVTRFQADHTRILERPDVQRWVVDNVKEFARVREEESRHKQDIRRTVVARFKGHSLYGEWQDVYREALIDFGNQEHVLVLDDTPRMASDRVGLMVRIVRCEDVSTQELQDELKTYADRHDRQEIAGLGISPFGTDSDPYASQILGLVGDAENRWIKAIPNNRALHAEIVRWLSRLHSPNVYEDEYQSATRSIATGLGPDRGVIYE